VVVLVAAVGVVETAESVNADCSGRAFDDVRATVPVGFVVERDGWELVAEPVLGGAKARDLMSEIGRFDALNDLRGLMQLCGT